MTTPVDTTVTSNAQLALNLAAGRAAADDSPSKVITAAKRFYRFLESPNGSSEE